MNSARRKAAKKPRAYDGNKLVRWEDCPIDPRACLARSEVPAALLAECEEIIRRYAHTIRPAVRAGGAA